MKIVGAHHYISEGSVTRNCIRCHESYSLPRHRVGMRLYARDYVCSIDCANLLIEERSKEKTCPNCNSAFHLSSSEIKAFTLPERRFCRTSCSREYSLKNNAASRKRSYEAKTETQLKLRRTHQQNEEARAKFLGIDVNQPLAPKYYKRKVDNRSPDWYASPTVLLQRERYSHPQKQWKYTCCQCGNGYDYQYTKVEEALAEHFCCTGKCATIFFAYHGIKALFPR